MARVLIVDDDDGWGQLVKRRLESAGIEAHFHRGSLGVLNVVRDGVYDLLLMDMKMPGLSGDRVVHTLYHARNLHRPKLVFCSAIDPEDLRELAEHLNADAHVSKSAGCDEVLRVVRQLLDQPAGKRSPVPIKGQAGDTTREECPVCGRAHASPRTEPPVATILLVEDNEMSRNMLARRLQRRNFAILVAVDGTQAIALAKRASPDLILMDISLPTVNGLDATRKLKSTTETCTIPVVAMTAYAGLYDREQCLTAGADEWEGKPMDFPSLLTKIDTLLAKRHATAY